MHEHPEKLSVAVVPVFVVETACCEFNCLMLYPVLELSGHNGFHGDIRLYRVKFEDRVHQKRLSPTEYSLL